MSAALIKVRKPGAKRFKFLAPKGATVGLRVYASRFEDRDGVTGEQRANLWVATNGPGNPGIEFKVVPACRS